MTTEVAKGLGSVLLGTENPFSNAKVVASVLIGPPQDPIEIAKTVISILIGPAPIPATSFRQEGDVLLFQTDDNGEMEVRGGIVTMTPSFETALYLSLFGGNLEDAGGADTTFEWWGDIAEVELSSKYRSETQNLLAALPITSGNLLRIEDAVRRDLEWLLDDGIASSVTVSASIPTLNRISIDILITAEGEETAFNFTENWKASS